MSSENHIFYLISDPVFMYFIHYMGLFVSCVCVIIINLFLLLNVEEFESDVHSSNYISCHDVNFSYCVFTSNVSLL